MNKFSLAMMAAVLCNQLFAQAPLSRTPPTTAKPSFRPVPTATGTPVFRTVFSAQRSVFVPNTWENAPQAVANPGFNNPPPMAIQAPNWNPALPAGWNPGAPLAPKPDDPAGWDSPPNSINNFRGMPQQMPITPSFNSNTKANAAFGTNPLPVLFP